MRGGWGGGGGAGCGEQSDQSLASDISGSVAVNNFTMYVLCVTQREERTLLRLAALRRR